MDWGETFFQKVVLIYWVLSRTNLVRLIISFTNIMIIYNFQRRRYIRIS